MRAKREKGNKQTHDEAEDVGVEHDGDVVLVNVSNVLPAKDHACGGGGCMRGEGGVSSEWSITPCGG